MGFRRQVAKAGASIARHFSRKAFAESLGLTLDNEDQLAVPLGTHHPQYRLRRVELIYKALGLDGDQPRRLGILMDNALEVHQRPAMFVNEAGDTLLKIVDDRTQEDATEATLTMNLSEIKRQMILGGQVQKLIALFSNQSIVIDSMGIGRF